MYLLRNPQSEINVPLQQGGERPRWVVLSLRCCHFSAEPFLNHASWYTFWHTCGTTQWNIRLQECLLLLSHHTSSSGTRGGGFKMVHAVLCWLSLSEPQRRCDRTRWFSVTHGACGLLPQRTTSMSYIFTAPPRQGFQGGYQRDGSFLMALYFASWWEAQQCVSGKAISCSPSTFMVPTDPCTGSPCTRGTRALPEFHWQSRHFTS